MAAEGCVWKNGTCSFRKFRQLTVVAGLEKQGLCRYCRSLEKFVEVGRTFSRGKKKFPHIQLVSLGRACFRSLQGLFVQHVLSRQCVHEFMYPAVRGSEHACMEHGQHDTAEQSDRHSMHFHSSKP